MCGIVGIASSANIPDRSWLGAARDAMLHRGPDDAGEWWSEDGRVGLAHRRLAILDLSSHAHQPMQRTDRSLTIVFNGEIYNFKELRRELSGQGHVFQSQSDTEVLLSSYVQWGTDCLGHLNGMFAFAIYDAARHLVFLARDRAGEKPLFYHLVDGTLCFASELKALLTNPKMPRCIDTEALDCYLTMGFVPGERCILAGYKKLPPAHSLTFNLNNGSVRILRYWQLPDLAPDATCDEQDLLVELEKLLEDAVSRQMVADVPVGILLSGGVDSSLITAMAARKSTRVRTFTIGFSEHTKFDERPHARLIARYFGTDHTELVAEPSVADLLPNLARQFDEPMVDSSVLPTWMVSNLVRQHCRVALGGDGGDELFGGYPHYTQLLWMRKWLGFIPLVLRTNLALTAERLLPLEGGSNFRDLGGYRSDANFGNGVRLLSSSFTLHSREGRGKYFDEIALHTQGLGNDPYQSAGFRLQKNRLYRYDLLWRSTEYYNPALPISGGQHFLDTQRRLQDHDFVLFPQSRFRFFAGYSRNS